MSKKENQFLVQLNSIEMGMLKQIIEVSGIRRPEAIRQAIRLLHRREFPMYTPTGQAVKRGLDKVEKRGAPLDMVDYCKNVLGGEFVEHDGTPMCKITKPNGLEYYQPL